MALLFAGGVALRPAPALARQEAALSVRGSVSDEAGAPIPGHVVRLIKTRTIVAIGGLERTPQSVEEARALTDAHGLFEFTVTPDPRFSGYHLRFYDPKTFDAVKYRLPEDKDVSARVRRGRPVQATAVLRFAPGWPRVEAAIERHGPASHCGQILRSLGLPDRQAPAGEGRELWSYDRAGVAYLVEGSRVLETRRTGPTAAGPRATDEAEPAERVEGS